MQFYFFYSYEIIIILNQKMRIHRKANMIKKLIENSSKNQIQQVKSKKILSQFGSTSFINIIREKQQQTIMNNSQRTQFDYQPKQNVQQNTGKLKPNLLKIRKVIQRYNMKPQINETMAQSKFEDQRSKNMNQTENARKRISKTQIYYNNLAIEYIKLNQIKQKTFKHIFLYKTNNINHIIQIENDNIKRKNHGYRQKPYSINYMSERKKYHNKNISDDQIGIKNNEVRHFLRTSTINIRPINLLKKRNENKLEEQQKKKSTEKDKMKQSLAKKKLKRKLKNFSDINNYFIDKTIKREDYKIQGWQKLEKQEFYNSFV